MHYNGLSTPCAGSVAAVRQFGVCSGHAFHEEAEGDLGGAREAVQFVLDEATETVEHD